MTLNAATFQVMASIFLPLVCSLMFDRSFPSMSVSWCALPIYITDARSGAYVFAHQQCTVRTARTRLQVLGENITSLNKANALIPSVTMTREFVLAQLSTNSSVYSVPLKRLWSGTFQMCRRHWNRDIIDHGEFRNPGFIVGNLTF